MFPRAYCRPWDVDDEHHRWRAALCSVGGDVALQPYLRPPSVEPAGVDDRSDGACDRPTNPAIRAGRADRAGRPSNPAAPRAPASSTGAVVGLAVRPHDSCPLLPDCAAAPILEAMRRRLVRRRRSSGPPPIGCSGCRASPRARALVGMVRGRMRERARTLGLHRRIRRAGTAGRDPTALGDGLATSDSVWTWRIEAEKLDVELDGRKYHASPRSGNATSRGTRIVAKTGWQTLRYSHDQLHDDPIGAVARSSRSAGNAADACARNLGGAACDSSGSVAAAGRTKWQVRGLE